MPVEEAAYSNLALSIGSLTSYFRKVVEGGQARVEAGINLGIVLP